MERLLDIIRDVVGTMVLLAVFAAVCLGSIFSERWEEARIEMESELFYS